MKLLLTSGGVTNTSIRETLVDLRAMAIDSHFALADDPEQSRPGHQRKLLGKEFVEPHPGKVLANRDAPHGRRIGFRKMLFFQSLCHIIHRSPGTALRA